MEPIAAGIWLNGLAVGAGAVWLAGAWFVASTRRICSEPLQGEIDVACDPRTVTTRLTQTLASARTGSPLQNSTIEAATEREVRWSSTGTLRHRGVVSATGDARRTRAVWEIQPQESGMQRAARIVVACGAVVTLAIYLALREFALPSEHGNVRGQVFQMVQAIHVLWPPFLLAGLARKLRRTIGAEVQRAVQNAPFA